MCDLLIKQLQGDYRAALLGHMVIQHGVCLVPHAEERDHLEPREDLVVQPEVRPQAEDGDEEDERGLDHLELLLRITIYPVVDRPGVLGEEQPIPDLESVQHGVEEALGGELGGAELEEEEVGVHHGLAEVALDVRHRLALDLKAISNPEPAHDLVEGGLEMKRDL